MRTQRTKIPAIRAKCLYLRFLPPPAAVCSFFLISDMPEFISGKRDRRPKFGRQLATVKVLSAQLRQSARSAMIHIYGKSRKVEFAELLCVSKAFGCQVKVVFVYYKGFTFPLVTTDLTLTAELMIEFYSILKNPVLWAG